MEDAFAIRMSPDIRSVTIGEHQAIIMDDFLADPHRLLEHATTSTFAPYPNLESRKGYPGIRAEAPAEYSQTIAELQRILHLHIGIEESGNRKPESGKAR